MPSTLSKVWLKRTVKAKKLGVPVDPTSDAVVFAVVATPGATPSTWFTGEWEPYNTVTKSAVARVLIGPGTTVGALAVGPWEGVIKITDSPEVPVERWQFVVTA